MRGYRNDDFSGKKVMASALAGIVAAGMLVSPAYAGTAKTAKRQSLRSLRKRKKQGMDFSWMTKPMNGTCMWMAR